MPCKIASTAEWVPVRAEQERRKMTELPESS